MISLETQHFNINRILLLIIGLWPYQRSLLVEFQLILLYGILMTFIVFQLTTFITAECTLDLIYKVLSSAFFYICFAIKYNSFWINADIIRTSLKQLQDVCNEITDKNEIAIIEKYGDKAKRITITILFLGMFYQVTFTLIYIWPYIHHIMAFTNKSRSHSSVHIMTEYFIDQEKHSYLVTLHRHAACCIGLLAMITTGTMLLTYAQHTCAMISIACYRIEHAMDILLKGYKNEQKSCEEIIHAVNIHRKAMNLINFLISNFSGSYFCLMAAGVLCLSCNLLRLTSFTGNIGQLILSLTNLIIQYVYLFLANYTAQEVTDHNEYLFTTVYNVRWYMAPIRTQKMILFLLQRGTKSFHLILGGVFVASLQSAASIASASISYFTVLYSTQQE
ncbi:odorant receptor 22b-like isoform X2 [Polyergus mexicanus]|uniref:odorant receptor 22b-like isoform X2 n=1 Tax=Polyergus mexicanus TaxID=615972 RepID=UPI0038B5980D